MKSCHTDGADATATAPANASALSFDGAKIQQTLAAVTGEWKAKQFMLACAHLGENPVELLTLAISECIDETILGTICHGKGGTR